MSDRIDISPQDLETIKVAKRVLTGPSITNQLSELIGKPLEAGLKRLPKNVNKKISRATETALYKGLEWAVGTMGSCDVRPSRDKLHKYVVTGTGAAAGAVGIYSLAIELPFSTCVMLRSIADIARSEGHDISQIETRLSCLEVFALGSSATTADDAIDTGYWAVRGGLAAALSDAGRHIAMKGLTDKSAPPLVRLIGMIASRFGTVVTAETAAKAVPVVGAVSGGTINYMFINRYQDLARAHFSIKRLEKTYGTDAVRAAYEAVAV